MLYALLATLLAVGPDNSGLSKGEGVSLSLADDEKTILENMSRWVAIRKSYLDKQNISLPALFGWTHYSKDDENRDRKKDRTSYQFQGAISLTPPSFLIEWQSEHTLYELQPVAAIDMDLSSTYGDGDGRIVHRLGLQGTTSAQDVPDDKRAWMLTHFVTATFDYTTDQDYNVDIIGGTFQYSPGLIGIGIGRSLHLENTVPVEFMWRPYIGTTFGNVNDPGENKTLAAKPDYADFFLKLAAEFRFFELLKITGQIAWYEEYHGNPGPHLLFGAAVQVLLDQAKRVSLTASYTHGEDPPTFLKNNVAKIAIGFKF